MSLRNIAIAATLTLATLPPTVASAQPRKAATPTVQTVKAGKSTAQCVHVSRTLTVCFK